jgi:hypothetical protein
VRTHRSITTSIGTLVDIPSDQQPAIVHLSSHGIASAGAVIKPLTGGPDEKPSGFGWLIGEQMLTIPHVFTVDAEFSKEQAAAAFTRSHVRYIGGRPLFEGVDFQFAPHQSNWLSNLTVADHDPLFRYLFSSTDDWNDETIREGSVSLYKNPDEALQHLREAYSNTPWSSSFKIIQESWEERCIVVERSPPVLSSLKEILLSSNGIAIGGFVGTLAGLSNPPFLLATVPLGILIVSASIGLSEPLQRSLKHKVTILLEGKADIPDTPSPPAPGPAKQQKQAAAPRGQRNRRQRSK